jgi:hypothetical protein
MPAKRRTTAKQKAAARKNLVKARKKWKGMSHKARKAAMPGRKKRRTAKRTVKRKAVRRKAPARKKKRR